MSSHGSYSPRFLSGVDANAATRSARSIFVPSGGPAGVGKFLHERSTSADRDGRRDKRPLVACRGSGRRLGWWQRR